MYAKEPDAYYSKQNELKLEFQTLSLKSLAANRSFSQPRDQMLKIEANSFRIHCD